MITEKKTDGFFRSALALQNRFEAAHRKKLEEKRRAANEKARLRCLSKPSKEFTYNKKYCLCLMILADGFRLNSDMIKKLKGKEEISIGQALYLNVGEDKLHISMRLVQWLINAEYARIDGNEVLPTMEAYNFFKKCNFALIAKNCAQGRPSVRARMVALFNAKKIMGKNNNA